jgi:hypothetical protein
MKSILSWGTTYFMRMENHVRSGLARRPILYTLIGGVAIVFFWRGVWHLGDLLEAQGGILGYIFSAPGSLIIALVVLLVTGLFVSAFVGDFLAMSGIKHEEKMLKKTEGEVKQDSIEIARVEALLTKLEGEIDEMKEVLDERLEDTK